MSSTRSVVTYDGSGQILLREEPIPQPGRGEVLIEVACSLISPGTELRGVQELRSDPKPDQPPRAFGYQNAGRVAALGEGCGDRFQVGQRVACMGANYALHATHACVPVNLCRALPNGLTEEEGAFNHLAATALQAIRRAEPLLGEHFLVMGLGLIGQLTGQLARLNGCRVIGVDLEPSRAKLADSLGFNLTLSPRDPEFAAKVNDYCRGYGVDCGILCFGGDATGAFQQILSVMKTAPDTHKMGRIVIVGGATINQRFPTALGHVDIRPSCRTGFGYHDKGYERGVDYPPVIVPWTTQRNLEEVLRLMEEERLNVQPLITHRFKLKDAAEACNALIERPNEAVGVILQMD
jgi:threonine dehydrogenase-like Zn-dependent dehydrogenase